jgi:3-oxoisoapionate decarboxylase
MQPGLTSYARGWACGVPGVAEPPAGWGIPDFLRESAADGAMVVQLSDNLPLRATSDARWRDHADLAAALGLELELGGRGLTEENLGAHLRLCRLLGIGLLRFVIDGPDYTPSVAVVEAVIRNQLSDVPSDGPLLALENHDRFPVRELSRLVSRIDDERVGICLDTANSLGAGEGLASVLTHLAPHTVNLHLKDIRVRRVPSRFGFIVSGCRLGDGVVDVAATLEILHRRGRCRSALIESWVEPGSGLEAARRTEAAWAREGLAFLNDLLARHDR